MKKLLYLFLTVLIVACSGDSDNNNNNDGDNNNTLNCDVNPVQWISYGSQDWTIENACNITYRDGTPIPEVTDVNEWNNLTTGAWCYYNNDPTNSRLYNWFAVVGIHDADPNTPNKEFAPEGWHVPSDVEWTTLEEYLIANGYNYDQTTTENKIAKAMASTTGWNTSTVFGVVGNEQSLNNSSGFNVFPEGIRTNNFSSEGDFTAFWSSTAFIFYLESGNTGLVQIQDITYNFYGLSVRFVRD